MILKTEFIADFIGMKVFTVVASLLLLLLFAEISGRSVVVSPTSFHSGYW